MGRIEDIISHLNTIAENPAKAIEDYKKVTGKGAVGVMPLYVPEEIIHAAGYLPVGMWGARKKEISRARTYLPPFACSIMQSVMELQLEGKKRMTAHDFLLGVKVQPGEILGE